MTKHIYLVYDCDEYGRPRGEVERLIVSPHSRNEVRQRLAKQLGHGFNAVEERTLNQMKREYLALHKKAHDYALLIKEAVKLGAK